jgi:hypothetical protein
VQIIDTNDALLPLGEISLRTFVAVVMAACESSLEVRVRSITAGTVDFAFNQHLLFEQIVNTPGYDAFT